MYSSQGKTRLGVINLCDYNKNIATPFTKNFNYSLMQILINFNFSLLSL